MSDTGNGQRWRGVAVLWSVWLVACGPGGSIPATQEEADADATVADVGLADASVDVPPDIAPDTVPADIPSLDIATLDVPVGCSDDAACAVPSPCILGTCVAGKCAFSTTTPANTGCDDGNACTTGDVCKGGVCVGGAVLDCDDGLTCTQDTCDLSGGCTHTDASGPCTDGNACTTGDTCALGLCAGVTVDCDDGNTCTNDACDLAVGCTHTANSASCDDGNACTTTDTCANGGCYGAAPLACSDGLACTQDGCDPASGCTFAPMDGACTDGDACTTGDTCAVGLCAGVTVDCDDGNACTNDGCDTATGCTHTANDGPCNDDNACTDTDVCANKTCAGAGVVCDDGDPCTADGCSPTSGCFSVPAPTAPGCSALSCEPSELALTDLKPVCPETECTPVCDPVDPATCVKFGTAYKCAPPKCSCGPVKKGVTCTLPPPQLKCDPVCEPPQCGISCPTGQCGNDACPACEGVCGEPKCALKCQSAIGDGACGPVFGCHMITPTCTTTCKEVTCYWVNHDDPAVAPACEAPPSTPFFVEISSVFGSLCGADSLVTPKAWGIVCQKPECEIKCPDKAKGACPESATCAIDCTNPTCNVTCDAPTCAADPVTGVTSCTPPTNCQTTCTCSIGTCTRQLTTGN